MSSRFARNSLFSTLAGLGTALASFLSMVIVARMLGTTGTGVIAYSLWIASLALTFADFGIYQTLSRYLPELTAEGDDKAALGLGAFLLRPYLLVVALGTVAFAAKGQLALDAGTVSSAQIWWLTGLLFTVQALSSFGIGFLRGMQRFDTAAKLTLPSLALQLAAVAIGAQLHGVEGALLGYCAGSLLPMLAVLGAAGSPARIEQDLRQRTLRFAAFSWAGSLTLMLVWSRLEFFFLERYHGLEAVALFSVGFSFATLAAQGPLLLTGGLLAHFSSGYGRRSREQTESIYATATRVMAFILLPACFGLAAILPLLVPIIYGSAFAGAVPAAVVLVAGAAIGATGSVGSQVIYAHDRSDFIFLSGLVGAALSIIAGFMIVPSYGMMGAALARTAIHAIMFGLGSWFIMRRLGLALPVVALAKLMLAAGACAAAAGLSVAWIHDPMLAVPAAVANGGIVYLLAVRGLQALPAHDIARLNDLCGRLPNIAREPLTSVFMFLAPRVK